MHLQAASSLILSQLSDLINQLSEKEFVTPSAALSQSTLGQHLRHTLEFFICLEQGSEKGIINYDKRAHDTLLERDKFLALSTLDRMRTFVQKQADEKSLKLEVSYGLESNDFVTVNTTYTRELIYNLEHAVHHMAIMKIGVREVAPGVNLPANFGIAASTVRHKETALAQ